MGAFFIGDDLGWVTIDEAEAEDSAQELLRPNQPDS